MSIINDKFGPEYVISVYDPKTGMKGFVVVDNTASGPGKGGIRMTPDVTAEEVFRLARTMTWKNSLFELPFGGAKAGMVWPGGPAEEKKKLVQSFARMISHLTPDVYIAGPDVSSGEREMEWFVEATGNRKSATGKPVALGGLPHELGSTGYGVAEAARVAAKIKGPGIEGATVAIEGFGNVGTFAFKFLEEMGAKIVAVSDSRGGIYSEAGLDREKLVEAKKSGKSVGDSGAGNKIGKKEIFGLEVDILIPASVTDVIDEENKEEIKAGILVEGANIPMRENIEDELWERGVLIVPDFIANGGGVISSYAEHMAYDEKKMFEIIKEKINKTTKKVLEKSLKEKINPRRVALEIARERLV